MSTLAAKPIVVVSRCLLGDEVRYDGGHKRADAIIEDLGPHLEWYPVCPEAEAGFGIPREPVHLVERAGAVKMVAVDTRRDLTAIVNEWIDSRIGDLLDIPVAGFILKSSSPSCAVRRLPFFDQAGVAIGKYGSGMLTTAVYSAFPGRPVVDESELQTQEQRMEFLNRLRVCS